MSIPFIFRILENPFSDFYNRYNVLCMSLQINGLNRIRFFEIRSAKNIIYKSYVYSFLLSFGDFSIISIFGEKNFYTISFYFYQQLSSYRNSFASVTALLIFFVCFFIISFFEFCIKKK